jgi:Chaperone of endosialidase
MKQLIQSKNFTTLIVWAATTFVCFGLGPGAEAVSPPPDGGYVGANTAEGTDALFSLTTGVWNVAVGFQALHSDTTGNQNTATGYRALFSNQTGRQSTAYGAQALYNNTTGNDNVATGFNTLYTNVSGNRNTGVGFRTLTFNDANDNTAIGWNALYNNRTGTQNTAIGSGALLHGSNNSNNTAIGYQAINNNSTGSENTVVGTGAGPNVIAGFNNTYIGDFVGTLAPDESSTIRIGDLSNGNGAGSLACFIGGIFNNFQPVSGSVVQVTLDLANDKLGWASAPSSARFKDEIKPMDKASEAILALKPVTFRYRKELDRKGIPQFGLVAEEVEKVNPDLVTRDAKGQVYTVRYEAVNAMLLNEFLKEHRKVQAQNGKLQNQARKIKEQEAAFTQLKKEMESVVAHLKEQDSKIQKVSDQIKLSKPTPRTVLNSQ